MEWHFRLGYTVLSLLLFRIGWGFVGGHWSRFSSFLYSPAILWRYIRGTDRTELSLGHNPLSSLSVFAMLFFLMLQVASGLFSDDDLMPDVYTGPYVTLEPGLAFVLDEDGRAVGYVLGAADNAAFAAAFREQWLPRVAARRPVVADPVTREELLIDTLLHPERLVRPELAAYPAHLHIDLLPRAQGQGWGRRLIRRELAELRSRGVDAVHLGYAPENDRAAAFYRRLGFREVPGLPHHVWAPTDLPA